MSKDKQSVHAPHFESTAELYARRAHEVKVLRAEAFGRALPSVDPNASDYERRRQEVKQILAIS